MSDLPDPVKTPVDSQKPVQTPPVITGQSIGGKERVEMGAGRQEDTPMTEFTRNVDLEPEVEGWLEKVEKEDSQSPQAITDDKGQVVLDDSAQQNVGFKVVLPMTKDEVEKGVQHKVLDSVRWLAEWCIRMVKMFGNKVAYRRK